MTLDSSLAYPGAAALLPSLGTVALIAGGTRRFGPGRLLSIAPLRFLGRISYSLYLVHWPILVLAPFVIGTEPDDLARLGLVGLSIVAAFASWALVETPFRRVRATLAIRPGRTVSLGLAAIFAVVVLAAGPTLGMAPAQAVAAADPAMVEAFDAPGDDWPDETPALVPQELVAATPGRWLPPAQVPATTAVVDVANHGAIPADVRPTLGKARADEDRLRDDGCLAFERVTAPPKCAYGAKDAPLTLALVGDSHAAQWFPALLRLAEHEGWRIVTFVKVSCPFIDLPVRNLALKREYRECAEFNEGSIAQLKALKPDLTLVSMSRLATHPLHAADDTVAARGAAIGRMIARIPGRTAIIVDTPVRQARHPGLPLVAQGRRRCLRHRAQDRLQRRSRRRRVGRGDGQRCRRSST